MPARWGILLAACLALVALPGAPASAKERTAPGHASAEAGATERRTRLGAVRSWRYQLRRIEIAEVAALDADLAVIDYAPDRVTGVEIPFSREDVARMQKKPDGTGRLVLAYLSIGEAERYRTYWNNAWYETATRPAWLLPANPRWDGNFPVRYWHSEWQAIVTGSPAAYLDRILAAGFDGVYLDRADVFQELGGENPRAEAEMARFVVRLAKHARAIKPDALVVMQNAEELVRRGDVRGAIDGIAKEDLLHGVEHDQRANPQAMVRASLADLRRAKVAGVPVLAVEYLDEASAAARAFERLRAEGFVPLIAERSLGTLDHHGAVLARTRASPQSKD